MNSWHSLASKIFCYGALATLGFTVPWSQAAFLPRGQEHTVLDRFTFDEQPKAVVPPEDIFADASFEGELLTRVRRPYMFEVNTSTDDYYDEPVVVGNATGYLEEWVVRRDDTGTLDFYNRLDVASDGFSGTIVKPWRLTPNESGLVFAYHDATGNPPTTLTVAGDGRSLRLNYLVRDDGYWSNSVHESSATMVFRSQLRQYGVEEGRLSYYTDTEYRYWYGGTSVDFLVPVPEPSTYILFLAGVAFIVCIAGRREPKGRR
jgi:hypothetical protein